MLEPAREGGLKLQKHIGEVLIGMGETDRPSCPTLSACFPDFARRNRGKRRKIGAGIYNDAISSAVRPRLFAITSIGTPFSLRLRAFVNRSSILPFCSAPVMALMVSR